LIEKVSIYEFVHVYELLPYVINPTLSLSVCTMLSKLKETYTGAILSKLFGRYLYVESNRCSSHDDHQRLTSQQREEDPTCSQATRNSGDFNARSTTPARREFDARQPTFKII
jgi:hypothetical protein